ncbi:oligosaccharide flippase family protein [Dietzia sp. DQ11-71]|nr:oligosaccharide flippase family protein [Dietzia sp. DQ11-71]MBB1017019.1 oligosaccharide flippase family protein [Dietzia sp. DQ11-71]
MDGVELLISRLPTVLRASAQSFIARVAVAPFVALMTLTTAGLVVRELGSDGYGLYAIIIGLVIILPFSDLGVGAALMDATARANELPQDILGIAKRSLTVLFAVSSILLVVAWSMVPFSGWSRLLAGGQGDVDIAAAVALSVFAAQLPLSLGARVLTGLELNFVAILFQALSPTLALAVTGVSIWFGANAVILSTAPFIGMALANLGASTFAIRRLGLNLIPFGRALRESSVPAAGIVRVAGPMLIITMALPVAYQFDRYILAHVSELSEVAQYSLAYQLYAPLVGLVASTATALWPSFIKHSDQADPTRTLLSVMPVFAVLGALVGAALFLFGRPVSSLVSGGEIVLRLDVLGTFALFLFLQSVSYPLATFLTLPRELRYQAIWHVVMAVANVSITVVVSLQFGAAGPMGASLIAVFLFLFVPQVYLVRSRRRYMVSARPGTAEG